MTVVVTRPEHEARQWVERLRAARVEAIALPLIQIGAAPDAAALHDAWARIGEFSAVMFVSANAVRGFFAARPAAAHFPCRAWAPGPGTQDALLEAQVPPASIDAPSHDAPQFDSEALWARVRSQARPGGRVLIVRGGDGKGASWGREWLAEQLGGAGVAVARVVGYVRSTPAWTPEQSGLAHSLASGATWLFSSSEAVANLVALMPRQAWGAARAVATHPRIARAAREAGFGSVVEARPAFDDVIAALESFE